ncbi:MAG: hypothetical protein ACYTG1_11385 [Planctomycetota bacterium]|jgi:MYXO-CTERM domain-containing protein
MNTRSVLCAAVVATAGLAGPALAGDVYSQLPHTDGGLPSDGVAGQYWSQRIADDFVLTTGADVNGAKWVGGSENFTFSDLTNFQDFMIGIYADNVGLPGAPIMTMTVPVATTSKVPLGLDAVNGGELFEFTVTFAPLALGPGTYHFSVGTVNVDPAGDGFVWNVAAATVNDSVTAELPPGGGFGGPFVGNGDMAFSIQGVPGPGGLALLGFAAAIGRRRRRA